MAATRHRSAVLALVIVGCGGQYGGGPAAPRAPASAGQGIEAAALPYQIVDARTGKSVEEAAFWARLGAARAVCVGEEHPNPHDHWLQLHVVRQLAAKSRAPWALAMEMFQRPFQGVLDDYAAHKIDAAQLRSRSGYAERWGYDFGFYGPTIDAAVAAHAPLLAANAAKELTKKVVRHGLESLTADEKAQLPQLKLDDAAHRAWFDALMEDLGGSSAHGHKPDADKDEAKDAKPGHGSDADGDSIPSADRVYTVQVIWDETMADTTARWLTAHPTGRVVLLAGNGHCHDSAIIHRLQRRGIAAAVSIRAIIDDGEGNVGAALARPMTDFLVVLQMPEGVERGAKPDAD